MKVGIVGYAGSGKSTVFQWLTGAKPDPAKAQMGQTGVAKMPDPRLDLLSLRFQPKKTTPTALEFLDTPGLMPDERRDNPRRLGILRESSGLLVVLNGYSETDLPGQLRRFREELMFADLEIISGRITRLEAGQKKPKPAKEREADFLRPATTIAEPGRCRPAATPWWARARFTPTWRAVSCAAKCWAGPTS